MTKSLLLCSIALTFSTTAALAQDGGNIDSGRQKSFTCMGCHGAAGMRNAYPGYQVPKLGGQHAAYIASALQAYKTGDRWHPTMQAHAATMTDEDMADIGAYFASLSAQ